MARINLDDPFFSDARVVHLAQLSGESKFSSRGRLVGLWHYCTERTRDRLSAIEINQQAEWFSKEGICFAELLAEVGLATKVRSGFRIKGIGERFRWLKSQREKSLKGGKANAAKVKRAKVLKTAQREPAEGPLENVGRPDPSPTEFAGEPRRSPTEIKQGPLVIDSIPLLSPDLTAGSPKSSRVPVVEVLKKPSSTVGQIWASYSDSFQKRYRSPPPANSKNYAHCAQLIKRIGFEEAIEVAAFYVRHNDAFYVRAGHNLALLVRDAEKIRTEWATGRIITGTLSRREDLKQDNLENLNNYLEKISHETA